MFVRVHLLNDILIFTVCLFLVLNIPSPTWLCHRTPYYQQGSTWKPESLFRSHLWLNVLLWIVGGYFDCNVIRWCEGWNVCWLENVDQFILIICVPCWWKVVYVNIFGLDLGCKKNLSCPIVRDNWIPFILDPYLKKFASVGSCRCTGYLNLSVKQ